MEITIKNIGWKQGTIGWLKKNLESKSLVIKEYTTKKGDLGLKMENGTKRMALAVYNPYDFDDHHNEGFEPFKYNGDDWDPGSVNNVFLLTEAAKNTMKNIAQAWCDKRNEDRSNENELNVQVIFA